MSPAPRSDVGRGRALLALLAVSPAILSVATPLRAKDDARRSGPDVDASLDRLVELQERGDGTELREWPYEGTYRTAAGELPRGYRVGGTAIVARALLEATEGDEREGSEPAGARRRAVDRALEYLLAAARDGEPSSGIADEAYDVGPWGHIYALSTLLRSAELGRVAADDARDACARLVTRLEEAALSVGGWTYSRHTATPCSFMTAAALLTLFEAKAAGFVVDPRVVDRAARSLRESRLASGAVQYAAIAGGESVGLDSIEGASARTPIVELALLLHGSGSESSLARAIDRMVANRAWLEARRGKTGTHEPPYMIAPYYFYFGHYYAARALAALPTSERERRRDAIERAIVATKDADGTWNDREFPRSRSYGTAMAILTLLAPELPDPPRWKPTAGSERTEP